MMSMRDQATRQPSGVSIRRMVRPRSSMTPNSSVWKRTSYWMTAVVPWRSELVTAVSSEVCVNWTAAVW